MKYCFSNPWNLAVLILAVAVLSTSIASTAAEPEEPGQEREYHLTLLAVSEDSKGSQGEGITADLYLRLASGTGNVFIEAEPVTKLDTRISLKLAKDIACESIPALTGECGKKDFFFRIEANASIIGGPSAGAAAAALAIAAVEDAETDQTVAITGTIGSGGLIGNVGGLKEKIRAASTSGIKTVLIPGGERYMMTQPENKTDKLDLLEYGESLGIKVAEAGDLQEALLFLTGKSYPANNGNVSINPGYSEVMANLADELCGRSLNLSYTVNSSRNETMQKIFEAAKNQTAEGLKKKEEKSYYSGASLCFGANIRFNYLAILNRNSTSEEALQRINSTADEITGFEKTLRNAETTSDLQIRGLVKERLEEARALLEQSREGIEKGRHNEGIYNLAYAGERFGSAQAWAQFLAPHGISGEKKAQPSGNSEALRNGCITRLQEADEHMQYLDVYLPGALQGKEELGPVYSYLRKEDYASCIYRASLAKAKANTMLSALSGAENITLLIDKKLAAARKGIIRQTGKGEFPIISYSYFEYANSLKQSDQPSALLFSEYALELSNLDIYIKHTISAASPDATGKAATSSPLIQPQLATALAIGIPSFAAGALLVLIVLAARKRLRKRKRLIVKATKKRT
ncbi:hypothetical protein HYU17_00880 [Candidatus Woesearchaeota archaeon]|nr:hypothetical protein [Candidatus Woesearchaeota archaeon]